MHAALLHQLFNRPVDARVQSEIIHAKTDPPPPGRLSRPLRFIVVGCVAAAVHWLVVVALVEGAAWRPLVANVAGWLVALGVSFSGHHWLTFRGHGVPLWRSAPRFVLVSAAGFAINEAAYALALRFSALGYGLLLAGVLIGVAFMTWALSRLWVFRGSSTPP